MHFPHYAQTDITRERLPTPTLNTYNATSPLTASGQKV
jgi:hypothetical protein